LSRGIEKVFLFKTCDYVTQLHVSELLCYILEARNEREESVSANFNIIILCAIVLNTRLFPTNCKILGFNVPWYFGYERQHLQ
jgi:hypothetical protein